MYEDCFKCNLVRKLIVLKSFQNYIEKISTWRFVTKRLRYFLFSIPNYLRMLLNLYVNKNVTCEVHLVF